MTDHANEIRDVLMWAQAYAPDRLAHRLIDAEESLRVLLAGHAAEVEQLRQEAHRVREALTDEQASSAGWRKGQQIAERERDEARADAERLSSELRRFKGLADEQHAKYIEARADAETLRQALRWFLDNGAWLSIGSIDNVWEPSRISRERREYLLAQLAAAQEPPASFTPDITHGKPVGKQETPADPRDKRFLPKYGKEGPPLPKRIVIGRNGAYWRDYGDGQGYSMAVVSTDNDPVEEFAVYVRQRPEPIACEVCHGAGHNIRGGKLVNCNDCLGSGRPQEPPALNADDVRFEQWMTSRWAVRVFHKPTGLFATCGDHGSQIANKEQALRELAAKVAAQGDAMIVSSHHAQEPPAKGDDRDE